MGLRPLAQRGVGRLVALATEVDHALTEQADNGRDGCRQRPRKPS